MSSVRRWLGWAGVAALVLSADSAASESGACQGVLAAVVPLQPVALSPQEAREEEEKVRAAVEALDGVCLVPRAHSANVLRKFEGHRLPACADDSCRKRLVESFGADWLFSGTAYGLGGGRTVNLTLWNAQGELIQRGSFARGEGAEGKPEEVVQDLYRTARFGQALKVPEEAPLRKVERRSRWPEVVMASLAVTALSAGVGFGVASQNTADRVALRQTGCSGTGAAYESCFAQTVRSGRQQAVAANALFGAGVLFGAGAGVMFALEWP